MAFRLLKNPGWVQQDVGRDPQMGDAAGQMHWAPFVSVPQGWCQGVRPSIASRGPTSALPGPLSPSLFPRPGPLLPEAAPSPFHWCIWHCRLAPGTALPQAITTPTAGEGREKPWPGPHQLRALTNQNLTGEAEKKTRSCDQPRDPGGIGTIGKPGADYPSGSAPCLKLPPPSYSPP